MLPTRVVKPIIHLEDHISLDSKRALQGLVTVRASDDSSIDINQLLSSGTLSHSNPQDLDRITYVF